MRIPGTLASVERACVAVILAVGEVFRLDLDGDAVAGYKTLFFRLTEHPHDICGPCLLPLEDARQPGGT